MRWGGTMSTEGIAYLELTLRKAAPGSARRVWAEAQLKALAGSLEREGAKGTKGAKREGGRR